MLFKDRSEAGKLLSQKLLHYKDQKDLIVLGIARGGVLVASEVAHELSAPLSVIVVRKVGAPHNKELALGAVSETGEGVFNENLIAIFEVTKDYLAREVLQEKEIAEQRAILYRSKAPLPDMEQKTVILIDDGIATGASVSAAIKTIRACRVKKLVLAAPVASQEVLSSLEKEVDELVCLTSPLFFDAIGSFYSNFDPVEDEEIVRLMTTQ